MLCGGAAVGSLAIARAPLHRPLQLEPDAMVRVHDTSGLQPFRLPSLTVLEAQASSAMAAEETDPIATPPTVRCSKAYKGEIQM
jgi:hypothetical protein